MAEKTTIESVDHNEAVIAKAKDFGRNMEK